MRSIGQNSKIAYTKEELFDYHLDKILLDWIKKNKPDIVEKAKQFVNAELSNK